MRNTTHHRHARPCPGHPRLTAGALKDVDGRKKSGHDVSLVVSNANSKPERRSFFSLLSELPHGKEAL
jgi:hypothetical protein